MDSTFRHPTTSFPQPRFARKNLGSFELRIEHDQAKNAFGPQANLTALLNFNGPIDLLKRFTDTSLPYTDTETFGQALISGEMSTLQYNFTCTQNFGSHFFISGSTVLSTDTLKNLLIQPIKNSCLLTSQTEIDANPAFKTYLQDLTDLLTAQNCNNTITQNNLGPSVFTLGYTTSLQDFERFDFIDITTQAGFCIPLTILDHDQPTLSAFPFTHNVNLGIPIMLSTAFGFYDWLNLGATGLAIFYLKNDRIIPLSTTATNNVLISEQGFTQVHHRPFLYLNAYLEAEQLIPRFTCLFGVSYEKQGVTCYNASDQTKFPNDLINKYPTHHSWERVNFIFSGELDLANETSKIMPRIKCMYVLPIWGVSVCKTSELMGQFAIECAYSF